MKNPSIDVDLIVETIGGDVRAAEFFEVTRQAVAKWRKQKKIPNARLLHLKAARPDLFGLPAPAKPAPAASFGEFGEPRSGMERRDEDRRQLDSGTDCNLGEARDGDDRQDDRRQDCGKTEAAA